jgi:hypothetical protein
MVDSLVSVSSQSRSDLTSLSPPRMPLVLVIRGIISFDNLSFAVAHSTNDTGRSDAISECQYALHVTSPFPGTGPRYEDDLIIPARDGTFHLLRFSRDLGVRALSKHSPIGAHIDKHSVPSPEFRFHSRRTATLSFDSYFPLVLQLVFFTSSPKVFRTLIDFLGDDLKGCQKVRF